MKLSSFLITFFTAAAWSEPILDLKLGATVGGIINALPKAPTPFDYVVRVRALPKNVVDSENKKTGGLKGSKGIYRLGFINSMNMVCYNITHLNFRGRYESPASTATHLHEAGVGKAGPPRISFPNPVGTNKRRNVVGCMKGPFRTGLDDEKTGTDTGVGFHVRQITRRPRGFFIDAHSSRAIDGAFRGQLPPKN